MHDAFVRSAPDRMEGAVPVAYVVTADGGADRRLAVAPQPLTANHIPAKYVAVPAIPRTGRARSTALDPMIEELASS